MGIKSHVYKALDEIDAGNLDWAMLHVCLATDATSRKWAGVARSSRRVFTDFVRNEYSVLTHMGIRLLDVENSRFDRTELIERPTAGDHPDLADILYFVHRCCHAHAEPVPEGFELVEGPALGLHFEQNTVALPVGIVVGLLASVVLAKVNADQSSDGETYRLWWDPPEGNQAARLIMPVAEWWGRASDFLAVATSYPRSMVTIRPDGQEWPVHVEPNGGTPVITTYEADL